MNFVQVDHDLNAQLEKFWKVKRHESLVTEKCGLSYDDKRTVTIREGSSPSQRRHVDSQSNPTDDTSRHNDPLAYDLVIEDTHKSLRKKFWIISARQTVRRVLNKCFIVLATLLCMVEAIVNGRPLTVVSDNPKDLGTLTPNHLLLLRPGPVLPPGHHAKNDIYCKHRWRQIQYLANVPDGSKSTSQLVTLCWWFMRLLPGTCGLSAEWLRHFPGKMTW